LDQFALGARLELHCFALVQVGEMVPVEAPSSLAERCSSRFLRGSNYDVLTSVLTAAASAADVVRGVIRLNAITACYASSNRQSFKTLNQVLALRLSVS